MKKVIFSDIIYHLYLCGVGMGISYNKLWKLLIDKKLKKKFLLEEAGLSRSTLTHMNHEEHVSTESLMKICRALQCDIGDIVEITYEKE